jgi:MFS family permease
MAASLLLFSSFQALFPTFPLYIVAIGGSLADNGLVTWAIALAALLTRPLAGLLADRWGRKPILVLGAILFAAGPPLYTFASNMPSLLVMRAVHGVGLALFTTAYAPFIADLLPPGRYGQGLGLANIASTVAMAAAPLFGERAVAMLDFAPAFLIFGAIGGVGVLATALLPGRRGRVETNSGSFREALRRPGVRAGALAMGLLGVPFGALVTFLPLLADVRRLGGTGLIFSAFAIASALAQPMAGRIADRRGPRWVTLVGLALAGLASAGFAGAADRWLLASMAVLLGVGGGAAQAGVNAWVQGSVDTSLRGSASAVQLTAYDTVIGFGSLGLGLLADATNYGVMYGVAGAITLLGSAGGLAKKETPDQRVEAGALE